MIEQLEQSSDNTLGYKVSGTVVKDDYEVFTREVQARVLLGGAAGRERDRQYRQQDSCPLDLLHH